MSESVEPRRVLYLVVEGMSPARPPENVSAEILTLTERNGREALEKIFAADTVAVWGDLAR